MLSPCCASFCVLGSFGFPTRRWHQCLMFRDRLAQELHGIRHMKNTGDWCGIKKSKRYRSHIESNRYLCCYWNVIIRPPNNEKWVSKLSYSAFIMFSSLRDGGGQFKEEKFLFAHPYKTTNHKTWQYHKQSCHDHSGKLRAPSGKLLWG